MAKKFIAPSYTFTLGVAGVSTVNLSGITNFNGKYLVAIINQTRGVMLYSTASSTLKYTSIVGTTVTLNVDTTAMNAGDILQVIYDVNGGQQSGSSVSSTVSTVITETAPTGATGFILMAPDTNTANIRFRIGATATTTTGLQLQAARDSGFIPCGANISICAESGTQGYELQWITSL